MNHPLEVFINGEHYVHEKSRNQQPGSKPTTTSLPSGIKFLLDFIAGIESNGNYNAYYGKANSSDELSGFTLSQIEKKQRILARATGSSAFGRYQFLRETLIGLQTRLGLSPNELFTPDLQDRLAYQLLKSRGLNRWLSGQMTDEKFMDNLSKEWASLPYHTGKSYYNGDSMNNLALTSRSEFHAAIKKVRSLSLTV